MVISLLISSIIIFICVLINKVSAKVGIPTLVLFIFLGMIFGSDGIGKIYFNNYEMAENICVVALVFIMFYGGFGTNWKTAKVVLKESLLLSTLGVVGSALITGILCYYFLKLSFWESILLGSVIGSTDAASVFSILRSKNLGIKENTAPVLELESGSNDPFAYMCMLICTIILKGNASAFEIGTKFFLQISIGILSGVLIAKSIIKFLKIHKFENDGFDKVFFVSVALFSYAFPTILGGNGFLSSYLVGIILGNQKIKDKRSLIHFFDGITGLMQLIVFFMLGLLSFPTMIFDVKEELFIVFLIITFVARPIAVFLIYGFEKVSFQKKLLVSFCGLRGAASIVFAIMVLGSGLNLGFDIFHIVFGVVLLSITFQGSLIPYVTKKLDMIDEDENILKTFSDYTEDIPVDYIELKIRENHPWINKKIKEINFPPDLLIVSIQRDLESILPNGDTILRENDVMVVTAVRFSNKIKLNLTEKTINQKSDYLGKQIQEIVLKDQLIILLMRNDTPVIPNGETMILENDILILSENND